MAIATEAIDELLLKTIKLRIPFVSNVDIE